MKKITALLAGSALTMTAQLTFADVVNGGVPLGNGGVSLGTLLPEALGEPLPFEMGGLVAISALSLIIGTQLIKRKK